MKKRFIPAAAALLVLTGCGRQGYEGFVIPEQGKSTLTPVADICTERHYEGIAPKQEQVRNTVRSADGICEIRCMESYYDVTLDCTKGSPYETGAAYAEAILQVRTDYSSFVEPYLYENIKGAFPHLGGDYSAVSRRTETIFGTLRETYQQEIRGFAEKISGGASGFSEDGILSQEEATLLQLVPDVLRGTACSAITADGSTTASGERITCRILEWQLGSENQICSAHALLHMKNGAESFTSVNMLGFLTILTAVNDDGLFMSIFDVGSKNDVPYTTEDKRSYTYDIRYALEQFGGAREAADYLRENARHYPYCCNVLCTDAKDACVAELSVAEQEGTPVVRDSTTALHSGLSWEDPAYLCVVNSFAAECNSDLLTYNAGNIVRWNRYADLFCGVRGLTTGHCKELLTAEQTGNDLARIRSEDVVHMVLADYDTHTLQAVLTGTDGLADAPEFIDLGSWDCASGVLPESRPSH